MSEIQVFHNDMFGEIRTTIIDGDPWFVAKDVADILGYSNSRKAIADHVDEEDKGVTKRDTLGGVQELAVINESGLYSLILSSKLPAAKRFKHWVTSEVLPSINRQGYYSAIPDEDLIAAIISSVEDPERRKSIIINALRKADIMQAPFVAEFMGLEQKECSAAFFSRSAANYTGKKTIEWWKSTGQKIYTLADMPERYRGREFVLTCAIKAAVKAMKRESKAVCFVNYYGDWYFIEPGYLRMIQTLYREGNISRETRDEWAEQVCKA